LLSFARRHVPEKRLISINEVIERSLELHIYQMRINNIEMVISLDPNLPMTMADFHQMQQVFVNITANAEQAMTEAHGGGKFWVKTQKINRTVRITFADNGPGIPEKNLGRIFDPFFTTKDVGKGTGLGLSICYGIVQEHCGHLYARSKPGKGATFIVEIPIISEEEAIFEQTEPIQVSGGQNG
jgi:two-component system NtrC family sensor kinase